MTMRINIISHVSIDDIVVGEHEYKDLLGGPPTYAGLTAANMGVSKVFIVSCVGHDFPSKFLNLYSKRGVDLTHLSVHKDAKTTRYRLVYKGDMRELYLVSKCKAIVVDELPGEISYVSPIVDEINMETVKVIAARSDITFLDPQGFFRVIKNRGKVSIVQWSELWEACRICDFIKLSKDEAETLDDNPVMILRKIALLTKMGASITMGPQGSLLAVKKDFRRIKIYHIPRYETRPKDPTGAGDVFGIVLLIELLRGDDPSWAGAMASAAASIVVEGIGASRLPERGEVLRRARIIYERCSVKEV